MNIPHDKRLLQPNNFLLLTIPSPHEPNTEPLNGLIEPFIEQVKELGKGIHHALHTYLSIHKLNCYVSAQDEYSQCSATLRKR